MDADHAAGQPALATDRGDGERRGVRREHAVVTHHALERGEQGALHAEVLQHRFDDQAAIRVAIEAGAEVPGVRDAIERGIGGGAIEPPLLDVARERLAHAITRPLDRRVIGVAEEHAMACGGRDLCDAAPHRAGAHHADDHLRALIHQHPLKQG